MMDTLHFYPSYALCNTNVYTTLSLEYLFIKYEIENIAV